MKKVLILVGVISIILMLVVIVVLSLSRVPNEPPVQSSDGGVPTTAFPTFPTGTDTEPDSSQADRRDSSAPTISLNESSGGAVKVRNFLNDARTFKDEQNEGLYYLGNNFPTLQGAGTGDPEYVILFIESTDTFNIALSREPIGESRQNAEQFLMDYLGLTKDQMCALNYKVGQ